MALETLAAKQIGALVVVERSIGLRNHIESGIPIDAVLTYDLLVSLFQPTSPLHDGAVIVQGDRIAAAACFLPLSANPRLTRDLGSRHRAALGVTEENDAVALVVSEETGSISLVLDGQIERGLTPEALRARLRMLIKRTQHRDRAPAGRGDDGLTRRWRSFLPPRRVEAAVDRGGGAAVARRRRRSDRRAHAARRAWSCSARPTASNWSARCPTRCRCGCAARPASSRAWAPATSRWSSTSTARGPAAGCSR